MKQYYIKFDIGWALIALCILAMIVLIAIMFGYMLGIAKAEHRFCDKFVK